MGDEFQLRVWDEWGKEKDESDIESFASWQQCRDEKRFPNGLIDFLEHQKGCGFPAPTPIQAHVWPILVQGKDVIGIAKTGSGKTLAFLLPSFIWLKKAKKKASEGIDTSKGPAILVMTPTRELCMQIYEDAEKFGKPVTITAACCYGGAPKRDQEWKIKEGPDSLIATPGRLNDFVQNWVVNLDMMRFICLDEADRMLDMGFEPQISQILEKCPQKRQVAMFTATWSKEVRSIANRYIKNPVQVQIGNDELTTNQNITQHIESASSKEEKMEHLNRILDDLDESGNCLVFCNTKKQCRDLAWDLSKNKMKTVELHGDLDQSQRDKSLQSFRSGEARVLVATDVASRGLDIRNVSTVVNWDAPNGKEDYVHRIGRTGRANDMGDAYTFLSTSGDEKKAAFIKEVLEQAQQPVPTTIDDIIDGKAGGSGGSSWGEDWKKDDKWSKDDSWSKDEGKSNGWGKDDKNDSWSKDDKSWDKEGDKKKKDDSWDEAHDNENWDKKEDAAEKDAADEDGPIEEAEEEAEDDKPKKSIFTPKGNAGKKDDEDKPAEKKSDKDFGSLGSALDLLGGKRAAEEGDERPAKKAATGSVFGMKETKDDDDEAEGDAGGNEDKEMDAEDE